MTVYYTLQVDVGFNAIREYREEAEEEDGEASSVLCEALERPRRYSDITNAVRSSEALRYSCR